MLDWNALATRVLAGGTLEHSEARAVLSAPDDELLLLLQASFRIRRHYHGREVRIHVLQNAKRGLCPEDCGFCSQSMRHASEAGRHPLLSADELVAGAREAAALGAVKYCMVTSTRSPSERDLEVICGAVRRIRDEVGIAVCTSLGLLTPDQASRLAEAGVTRFNHNLETSRDHFGRLCTTHTYEDRVATVRAARAAGMEACCGGIMGLGETMEDRVALAFELRALEVESIPVNFLDPRPGTPLADHPRLSPQEALRTLALFRFVNPSRDIRVAGGREVTLGHLQPLALYPANSLFSNGYLTTPGQGADRDRRMIAEAGFVIAEGPSAP